jgi:hypothetical protein
MDVLDGKVLNYCNKYVVNKHISSIVVTDFDINTKFL